MTRIEFGQATDIGKVRQNNEDAVLSIGFTAMMGDRRVDGGIFAVIDGIGGKKLGQKAAEITASTLSAHLSTSIPEIVSEHAVEKSITDAIAASIQAANKAVYDYAEMHSDYRGAGAVATVAVVVDDNAYLGHVGDTIVFLITPSNIQQITRTHDMVHALIAAGHLTMEDVVSGKYIVENLLYRALGMSETVEVDTLKTSLLPDSHLLLCSDGLQRWGSPQEDVIARTVRESPDPQHACDQLIALANEAGGEDNISVIVIRMVGE